MASMVGIAKLFGGHLRRGRRESGVNGRRQGLRPEADKEERGQQDQRRHFFAPTKVRGRMNRGDPGKRVGRRSEKYASSRTQTIDRRDHDAGYRESGDQGRKLPEGDEDREFAP